MLRLVTAQNVTPRQQSVDSERIRSMHQKMHQMEADEGSNTPKTVHSGHFMISTLDGDGEDDDDIGVPLPAEGSNVLQMPKEAYDFDKASKTTSATYSFQGSPKIIDNSLAKLFRAMTLAYSGQITSPKFKSFKGMKLNLKDKLRLNNIIWREWHMQYIKQRRPVICSFNAIIDDVHQKPEAVVLEGKYWKRRLEIVCSEYKKWRVFFKEKMRSRARVLEIPELLDRVAEHDAFRLVSNQLFVDPPPQLTEEDLRMDFSDTLFSSLNQPFHFPNPREMGQLGNADFIQPALIGLQPNLDDVNFMDTVDPLHEFLMDTPFPDNIFGGAAMSPYAAGQATTFKANPELQFPSCAVSLASTAAYASGLSSMTVGTAAHGVATASELAATSVLDTDCQYVFYTSDDLLSGYLPGSCLNLTTSSSSGGPGQALATAAAIHPSGGAGCATAAASSGSGEAGMRRSPRSPATRSKADDPSARLKMVSNKPRSIAPAPRTGGSGLVAVAAAAATACSPATLAVHSAQPQQQQAASAVTAASTFLAQLLTAGSVLVSPASASGPPPSATGIKADLSPMGSAALLAQYQPIKAVQLGGTHSPPPLATARGSAVAMSSGGSSASASASGGKQRQASRQPSQSAASPPAVQAAPASPLYRQLSQTQTSQQQLTADSRKLCTVPPPENLPNAWMISAWTCDVSVKSAPFFQDDSCSLPESAIAEAAKAGSRASPGKSDGSCGKDGRRISHISAEQKRRGHIKSGFDVLHTLIPALSQNPNTKVSKAAMLQKTAEYCRKLKAERSHVQEETDQLKQEIEALNASIANCQSQLPATGAPVTRQRNDQMKEAFTRYVQERTLQNWKFYILSKIAEPLFDSFNSMVSTASLDELYRTSLSWLEQHGSLPSLRPVVLESLRQLSRSTNILTDPSSFPKQAVEAVTESRTKGSSR